MTAYSDELKRRRANFSEADEKKFKEEIKMLRPNFSLVAGTDLLDEQIKLIRPQVHIYGHSHRKMETLIDGTRYINNPLGYGRERKAGLIVPPHDMLRIDL